MKIVILGPAHPYRGGIAALNERLAIQFIREGPLSLIHISIIVGIGSFI